MTVHIENPGESSGQMVTVHTHLARTEDQSSKIVFLVPQSVTCGREAQASPGSWLDKLGLGTTLGPLDQNLMLILTRWVIPGCPGV